jgi:hypothetical protein
LVAKLSFTLIITFPSRSLGTVRLEAGVIWEVKVLLQEMPTPGS